MSDKSTDDTDDMRNPDVARALRLEEYDRRQQEDKAISSSREELPSEASLKFANELDDEMRAGLGIGELALRLEKFAAGFHAPAQSPKQCGESCEFFDMLWKWFEDESRIGADGMRPERHEGLSADDFRIMLDEHEAALSDPSTGLPAPAPQAEVRDAIARIIPQHIFMDCSFDECPEPEQKAFGRCADAILAALPQQDRGGK